MTIFRSSEPLYPHFGTHGELGRARRTTPAGRAGKVQPCRSSNQVTVRPPRRRQPDRGQDRHQPKPPAAFRIPASRTQFRPPGAAAIGDFHPDHATVGHYRDRNRLPGITRPAIPHTIAEKLTHQQDSHIPARMPRAEHRTHELPGDPRPLRPPGHRHALPNHQPSHQRTRLPGRPSRENHRGAGRTQGRGCTLDSAAHVKPEHAASAARPWPSVENRRCRRPFSPPGRRPLYVRGCRNTGVYSATR